MAVERVVVIPRNGYVNRLQAWASSAALATEWGAPLAVCWEPETVAPAQVEDLFDSQPLHQWISPEDVEKLCGAPHHVLPRYLTRLQDRQVLVLAGHDRGEQVFMDELNDAVESSSQLLTVVIIAGGHFGSAGEMVQRQRRSEFYRRLPWRSSIRDRVNTLLMGRSEFMGLHIRQTDRSQQAPTAAQVVSAVTELHATTGYRSIFIAADTAESLHVWRERCRSLELESWTADTSDHARDSIKASVDALVEWQVLGRSAGLVFSAASSFGAEAAVAAGDVPLMQLTATPARQRIRAARNLVRDAVTYPLRHGPFSR